jgi:hypothetical protein
MNEPMKLKKVTPVVEDTTGVCVWVMPDGTILGDGDGRILSLQGALNDLRVEKKMQDAAKYWAGESAVLGKCTWVPGARQVTDAEAEDQRERFEAGEIPDLADSARQLERRYA